MPSGQSESRKVYVVEVGCYSDRYIAGVYSTPEAAMAAHPIPERMHRSDTIEGREPEWKKDPESESWSNGLDWGSAASIDAYELEG